MGGPNHDRPSSLCLRVYAREDALQHGEVGGVRCSIDGAAMAAPASGFVPELVPAGRTAQAVQCDFAKQLQRDTADRRSVCGDPPPLSVHHPHPNML